MFLLGRCSFSAASYTWHALRFGGDRLAGRVETLWSRRAAAGDFWGSKRELTRRTPYGDRCNSVGVGCQFIALEATGVG